MCLRFIKSYFFSTFIFKLLKKFLFCILNFVYKLFKKLFTNFKYEKRNFLKYREVKQTFDKL